ncbi:MAG: SMI1/KNR4 family protein [Burkholderiales bacterium]|nr:SMI1/KNR4 family protein [Burkholderiales bacterium]
MPMTQTLAQVLAYWKKSGIAIRPGAAMADIESFQLLHNVNLPADVLRYLLTVDGSDEMDDGLYRFWPLAEIVPVHEFLRPHNGFSYPDQWVYPDFFVFADHLIDSWNYAVLLTAEPEQPAPVYRIGCNGGQVAASFRAFMESYARDPASVL